MNGGQSVMGKNRMEAFFDGVVAIIITIMVLEMKVPHGDSIETLSPLIPVLLSYVLSFLYLGIYWNNHHHMMHAPSLLAIARSVHNGLDGRKPFRGVAGSCIRCGAADGRDRVLDTAATDHRLAGRRLGPEKSHRQRLERQALSGSLCRRNHLSVSVAMGIGGDLRVRCAHVGRSGQTHRAHSRRKGNIASPCSGRAASGAWLKDGVGRQSDQFAHVFLPGQD